MVKQKKGDAAINIQAEDISGSLISLEDNKGKKIFLSFYRGASCPFCNLRIHELINQLDEFHKNGLIVIGVFKSSKNEILKYMDKQNPPFPIIPDPEKKYYKLYGLRKSFMGMIRAMFRLQSMGKIFSKGFMNLHSLKDDNTLPGDFLIDENGIIQTAYYGKDFGDHIDFKEVHEWLKQ